MIPFSKNVAFSQLNIDNTTVILYSKETSQINFPYNLKEDAIKYNTYAGILREESKKIIDYWNDDYYKTSYDILLKNYELSQELLINTSKLVNETYQTVEKHNTIAKIHKNNIK
ncbi:MAG: hypothetical protein KatS3mg002_0703 [Candidatus Woesearchaeota archaeon]|nr:MAG: hypothetical protein KatS3mg002_0703 [Candidatus Woesearchaeota archaeon]